MPALTETVLGDPMAPLMLAVRGRRAETADTFTVELESPPGFTFGPGQFNMLYVFGTGESAISISGDPEERGTLVHTIREVGAVTRGLSRLRQGDALGVRGPFGTAWPVEEARGRDVVIVAGGIGLAPLRPAIYHLLAHRADYGRVVVLYGSRTPRDLLFAEQLQQWRGRFDMEVEVTVDGAGSEWHGSVGVVTKLIANAPFDPERAVAFVCGPEIMMRFTGRALAESGVGADRIYVSMERSMKCAVGFCGHCQLGPMFVCKDGPVFRHDRLQRLLEVREV